MKLSKYRIVWKFYFGLMSLLTVGSVIILPIEGPHSVYPIADYIILALTAVQVVGLYGHAFQRSLLSERFWQLAYPVFVLNLVATLLVGGVRYAADRGDVGVVAATMFASFFGLLLFLPLLIADRRYAFRSPEIWKEDV